MSGGRDSRKLVAHTLRIYTMGWNSALSCWLGGLAEGVAANLEKQGDRKPKGGPMHEAEGRAGPQWPTKCEETCYSDPLMQSRPRYRHRTTR